MGIEMSLPGPIFKLQPTLLNDDKEKIRKKWKKEIVGDDGSRKFSREKRFGYFCNIGGRVTLKGKATV